MYTGLLGGGSTQTIGIYKGRYQTSSPAKGLREDDVGSIWAFPKIRDTLLGGPLIRIIVYCGLYWGPPILGNYHMGICRSVYWFTVQRFPP